MKYFLARALLEEPEYPFIGCRSRCNQLHGRSRRQKHWPRARPSFVFSHEYFLAAQFIPTPVGTTVC